LLYSTFSLFMNDSYIGEVPGLLDDNKWTQLAITWDNNATDGKREKIYKNGQFYASFNAALSAKSPATVYIGNRFSENERWVGGVDEYGLWNRALLPGEVAWLSQNSIDRLPEPGTLVLLGCGLLALVRRRRGH
jgi:hypothetical protein